MCFSVARLDREKERGHDCVSGPLHALVGRNVKGQG